MVGGRNYDESPFNLATEGERQPGSSFKAFDLAAALEDGISPELGVDVQGEGVHRARTARLEKFVVHNDEGDYTGDEHADRRDGLLGQLDLRRSRAESRHQTDRGPRAPDGHHDAALDEPGDDDRRPDDRRDAAGHGARLRDDRPRRRARQRHAGRSRRAGRDPGSRRPAASALPDGSHDDSQSASRTSAVLPADVASTETSMLETVLQYGTGKAAAIGQFAAGKTGTTSNYGDAWFVGWDSQVHGRGVGRLSEQADPDDHRLRRRRPCSAAPSRR